MPGQATLANITACQARGGTPYCWPPNGTRICVPGPDIPFYWPPTWYPDSDLNIGFTTNAGSFPTENQIGNMTKGVSRYDYQYQGVTVPGEQNARSVDVYMQSRSTKTGNMQNWRGPVLILVKTAEFTSTLNNYTTNSSSDDDDKDSLTNLTSGQMTGIIIAILAAVIGFVTLCCCCGCCGCCANNKRRARPTIDSEEQARVIVYGTELLEQRPKLGDPPTRAQSLGDEEHVEGGCDGQNESRRLEMARERDSIDPPPKYTP
jgi:hypothetical protein